MRNPMGNGFPVQGMPGGIPDEMMGSIQSAFDSYSGKSKQELMSELTSARQSGRIDAGQLTKIAAMLSPMLSAAQRERLSAVIKQLN